MTKQSIQLERPKTEQSVLDHAASEALALERAREYALPKTVRKRGGIPVILFRVCSEWLAVASELVKQVTPPRKVRTIPHRAGKVVQGIANFNGEILVVVSLSDLLGVEPSDEKEQSPPSRVCPRTMLIGKEGRPIAVRVDALYGKYQYQSDQLHEPPATLGKAMRTYSKGIVEMEGRQVGILDADLLLYTIEQHLK